MWEIYKSGSTRGEWVVPCGVALSPTLPSSFCELCANLLPANFHFSRQLS